MLFAYSLEVYLTSRSRFGEIRSLTLVRDVVTRISKGYAFVHFARSKEARRACENADGGILAGRPVRCQLKVGGVMMVR